MKKPIKSLLKENFSKILLSWDKSCNSRKMPWKGEKDPYKIWISEIILQQTRVEQGLKYYDRFIRQFPNIQKLARSADERVLKLWEGLGYYSRCRNLLFSARSIIHDLKGKFPDTYEDIIKLKGVGPSTAAAIASFAFQLPYAVTDGNVFRVLARIFGIKEAINSSKGKKLFTELAEELLCKKQPARYNQAIMDFGAVQCKPVAPLCYICIFRLRCAAYKSDLVKKLPVKEKRIHLKYRWFYYLLATCNNRVAIRRRTAKDIWQGLYEFPLLETSGNRSTAQLLRMAVAKKMIRQQGFRILNQSAMVHQRLTHQIIKGRFIYLELTRQSVLQSDYIWVEKKKLSDYSFPKILQNCL